MTKIDRSVIDPNISILTSEYASLKTMINSFNGKPVELDLGCGKGSYSTLLAQRFEDREILAADVMLGRLRRLVKRNIRQGIDNMSVLRVEAKHLVSYMLPDDCLDRLHVLCPDPWPKFKHRHNRLISSQFLRQIKRVLKDNGVFHFSSDDHKYFESVCQLTEKSGLFVRDDTYLDDIVDLRSDFELRWLDMGRTVQHGSWVQKK